MTSCRKQILLILITLLASTFCYGESKSILDQLNEHVQEEVAKKRATLNGSIILISGKSKQLFYASQDVSEQSQFYIGSLTKQMTAFRCWIHCGNIILTTM